MLKYAKQVAVLSVNISDDFDGGLKFEEHGLGHENLSGFDAKGSDFDLLEFEILGFCLEEFVDDDIYVDLLGFFVHEVKIK